MADRSNRRYGDTLDTQQFGRQPNQLLSLSITRTSTPSLSPNSQTRCIHTPPQDDQKHHPTRLSSLHLTSSIFTSLHRTNNNKHNDTVNLHAQNCCTHKPIIKLIQKNLQIVYKSKRNLVPNDVQVSHTEFTIIITDQLMVEQ